jgi:hypothetical protein
VPSIIVQDGMLTVHLGAFESMKAGRDSVGVELWRVKFVVVDDGERRNKLGTQEEGRTSHIGVFVRRGEKSFVFWPKKTPAVIIQVTDPLWSEIIIGDANAKEVASQLRLEIARAKAE